MLFNNRFDYMATPRALAKLEKTNVFVDSLRQRDDVKAVTWKEVAFEEHLGNGRFCSLFHVKVSKFKRRGSKSRSRRDCSSTSSADDATRSPSKSRRYALKCLDINMRPKEFVFAAMDLLYEAGILASIDHENIVRLRGISTENLAESYRDTNNMGFFFLYDLISESLRDRFAAWEPAKQEEMHLSRGGIFRRSRKASSMSPVSSYHGRKSIHNVAQVPSLEHRLQDVALGIAKGLVCLHKQNIVLRALNPETGLGFDSKTGKIKLCDLGLARPVEDVHDMIPTSMSPFYKAPEYFKRTGCELSADVYSFGMVLYELVTLSHPFEKYQKLDRTAFENDVILDGQRPSFDFGVSPALKSLIRSCWDNVARHRPTMVSIVSHLEDIIACTKSNEFSRSQTMGNVRRTKSIEGPTRLKLKPSHSVSMHDKRTAGKKYQVVVLKR